MNEEEAFWYLNEQEEDYLQDTLREWGKDKGDEKARQGWRVIPAGMLLKEWRYNLETGQAHESVIEKMQEICIENYCKIYINSVLMGHTSLNPYSYAEIWVDENWDDDIFEEWLEDFEWWACDEYGNWRISDYGLDKMSAFLGRMLQEDKPEAKLFWIDQILSVSHQRSDLARWFVEGGSATLNALAEREPE